MSRTLFSGLIALSGLALLGATSSAKAIAIRIAPVPERVATADGIVFGKVTSIEAKTVEATPYPEAKDKVEYYVAVVKVEEGFGPAKGEKEFKVAYQAPPPAGGGGGPIRPGRGFGPPKLEVEQEGCFFLTKHHDGKFYYIQNAGSVINKKDNPNYEKQTEMAKKSAKVLADAKANLKAKDAETRALAAELLLIRHTTPKPGETKQEPIDAEESKLILQGLADGDWSKQGFSDLEISPNMTFYRLNAQPKDGWNPAGLKTPNEIADAAKKWLKDNADKFRVQHYVSEKKSEK